MVTNFYAYAGDTDGVYVFQPRWFQDVSFVMESLVSPA